MSNPIQPLLHCLLNTHLLCSHPQEQLSCWDFTTFYFILVLYKHLSPSLYKHSITFKSSYNIRNTPDISDLNACKDSILCSVCYKWKPTTATHVCLKRWTLLNFISHQTDNNFHVNSPHYNIQTSPTLTTAITLYPPPPPPHATSYSQPTCVHPAKELVWIKWFKFQSTRLNAAAKAQST